MLDAAQRASANAIVDFFELLDLDPDLDEIVYEDGFRYHRHPNGRLGSDIVLDIYAFGLPADETITRAQTLGSNVPHWLEPFGAIDDDELQRYAMQGYRALGEWFVMRHRMEDRPLAGDVPVELVADAESEGKLAALHNARADVGHRIRPGQYTDARFILCWIPVDGAVAAMGQTVIVQNCAYVCEMVTYPEYRRRGFAGAIFQELLGHAYDRGAREAVLVSTPMAHELYRSRGFVDVAPIRVFEWRPPDTEI